MLWLIIVVITISFYESNKIVVRKEVGRCGQSNLRN